MNFKKLLSTFKSKWQAREMGQRSLDMFWDAMLYFAITQVIAVMAIVSILRLIGMDLIGMDAAGPGIAFLILIFELMCAIAINHEFSENSLRYRLDQIIENTDSGAMHQLAALIDELSKKEGLS